MEKVINVNELRQRTFKLIKDRGVMQAFLAESIGVTRSTLSKFLNGIGNMKDEYIEKLDALIDTYYTKLPVEV